MATKKTTKKIATTSTEEQGAQGATKGATPKARTSRSKRAQGEPGPAPEPVANQGAQPEHGATAGAAENHAKKPTKRRLKATDQPELAPDDPQRIHERTVANLPGPPDMRPANVTSATLLDASTGFLAELEAEGASEATVSGYKRELVIALDHFGESTVLCSLTPKKVQNYFESDRVMIARNGAPKAEPSWQRTRRVLRLALCWAVEQGMLEVAPLPAKAPRKSNESAAKAS